MATIELKMKFIILHPMAIPFKFRIAKLGVPMPVHLYGQLTQHGTGRELLLKSNEVERLLNILRDSPLPTDTYQISKIKGALYALGHIVATLNPSKFFKKIFVYRSNGYMFSCIR